ncbi:MAG: hypothetical protein NTY29_06780 [Proteobacteria bacterium]|nr:hypothetical protein [Pseudomonadota bacterium]
MNTQRLSIAACLVFTFSIISAPLLNRTARAAVTPSSASLHEAPSAALSSPAKKKKAAAVRKKSAHRRKRVNPLCNPMPPLGAPRVRSEVPLLPVIEKGRSLLKEEKVSYTPWTRSHAEKREVKLALANLKTGSIRIVSGWTRGENLFLNDGDIVFEIEWWNGFNSAINILKPEHTAVVAMLYALEPARRSFFSRNAILYTPYSSALMQPELVAAGKTYLLEKIASARQELKHIGSQAFPGRSLASSPAFTPEDYLAVIVTEQMDPGRFYAIVSDSVLLSRQQNAELARLAERILVIIGANREDAYRFTGNYAGARGITQFTTMGMRVVWDNYPTSGISSNFHKATSEHVSAIKAEICLLDRYLAEIAGEHPKLLGSGFEKYAAAAAYNGGPERVKFGLEHFGLKWLNPRQRRAILSGRQKLTHREQLEYQWLKTNQYHETFIYLMKLHALEQSSWPAASGVLPVQPVINAAAEADVARD